jgi:hypothetical protein
MIWDLIFMVIFKIKSQIKSPVFKVILKISKSSKNDLKSDFVKSSIKSLNTLEVANWYFVYVWSIFCYLSYHKITTVGLLELEQMNPPSDCWYLHFSEKSKFTQICPLTNIETNVRYSNHNQGIRNNPYDVNLEAIACLRTQIILSTFNQSWITDLSII